MSDPELRRLIDDYWASNGGWLTPAKLAPWLGRPVPEVRRELKCMESEGLAKRWRAYPADQWRFGPTA